jgi:hypothetical protein
MYPLARSNTKRSVKAVTRKEMQPRPPRSLIGGFIRIAVRPVTSYESPEAKTLACFKEIAEHGDRIEQRIKSGERGRFLAYSSEIQDSISCLGDREAAHKLGLSRHAVRRLRERQGSAIVEVGMPRP